MRARYYNPKIQRFINVDPIRNGYNWYSYCGGNPIAYIDSSGEVYIIAWSYGQQDVGEFEKYLFKFNIAYVINFDITVDKSTADWYNEIWEIFEIRSPFSRAAKTKKKELLSQGVPEKDIIYVRIDNKSQLEQYWKEWSEIESVDELFFFSHGYEKSADVYQSDCQEFWEDSTQLNWKSDAVAYFYGCNTGLGFAQMFADRQGITTYGQMDYTNFSKSKDYLIDIGTYSDKISGDVYMRTFKKIGINTKNGGINIFGINKDGEGKRFEPTNKKAKVIK